VVQLGGDPRAPGYGPNAIGPRRHGSSAEARRARQPTGKSATFSQRWILLDDDAQFDGSDLDGVVGRAAQELPTSVSLVMSDEQNRLTATVVVASVPGGFSKGQSPLMMPPLAGRCLESATDKLRRYGVRIHLGSETHVFGEPTLDELLMRES
jgi:hypothetical protein